MTKALGFLLVGGLFFAGCATHPTHVPEPPSTDDKAATQPAAEAHPPPAPEAKARPFPGDSFYDLLVAEFALRRGEYDLALGNYLQQAHATHDSGVIARASRLAQFLKADRAALDSAQLWVAQEPDDMEAQFTLASELAKAQRPLEAMEPMTKVLDAGTKANFAVIAAAALQQPESVQTRLLDQLNQLLATHKDNVELMTGKALLLQQRGQRTEALALIRKVLDIAPDETHAIIIEAKLLEEMGRPKEAFARLQQMVEQNPYNRRLRLQYARLLTQSDMNKAREQFAILVAQSPGDADMLLSLALVSKETNALDEAEAYFQKLLAMNQHVQEAHFYLGQIAEQRGDRDTAIKHYEEIPPGPDFFPALGRILELQLADNNIAGARKHLRDLRERYPQHAVRLYLVEAELLMQTKEYQAGNELMTEALKKYPLQPNLLYTRSTFSERRHDIPLLEKDLRAILSKDPNNAVALNALGYSLANLTTRYQEAHALIQKALEQKPEDPAIMDSMGWAEYRLGNIQSARDWLEKAYAAFPDPEVAAHLGEVLWQAGNEKRAREIWSKALQETPDNELVRAALKRYAPDALPAP
ncbi:MAG TPA: tetratricopeptide repeat protein [Spongiibacteraceae bacterium]|jgi:tetratricopeptide (TPR) repeat protein